MNISRRAFVKKGMIVLAGAAMIPNDLLADGKEQDKLAIQLWTVRENMKENPLKTLKQLAGIGYKNVEHANYINRKFYGYKAKAFKKILEDLRLNMFSGHVSMGMNIWNKAQKDFTDKWKYTLEDAATAGQQYLITPALASDAQKDYDKLMRLMDVFNKCGALCKKYGLHFGYHNDFSFDVLLNKKRLYDIILQSTDRELVTQEFDIGNMYGALQNENRTVLDILKENPGRFPLMHVKDEMKISGVGEMKNGYQSTILGKGEVPVKTIIDYAKKHSGTRYFIVEQESYQNNTPMESAESDYEAMKKWGF